MPIISENNLNNTSVLFLYETSIKSQIIYIVTLLSIFVSLLALPFIYTSISIKCVGMMQSNIERAELLAPSNGRLVVVNLKDNQRITKGATLLTIDATLPNRERGLLNSFHDQLLQQLKDANTLLSIINSRGNNAVHQTENPKLQTNLYAASWQEYLGQIQNMTNAKEHALSVYHRYQTLYSKRVVAQTEYEQYQFNYQQALSDLEMVTRKHKRQWQTEVNQYRNELRNLQKQQAQLDEQKNNIR